MGKKCPPCECKAGLPLWLGTFGDLMSLLLTFFILLLSMASFDAKKLIEAEGSISGALSLLPGGMKTEPGHGRVQQLAEITLEPESADEANRVESLIIEFQEMAKIAEGPSNAVGVGSEGFLLRLPASLLFKDGGTEIATDDGFLFVKRMAEIISRLPKDVYAEVRGHTDLLPVVGKAQEAAKLELTAKRALSVSKVLIKEGISPLRITTLGRGDQEPLTRAMTAEAHESNRRVDIYLYPKNTNSKPIKTILDQAIERKE
ncbi:MAG: flagellar motor protein MotB [Wolinella sp.]